MSAKIAVTRTDCTPDEIRQLAANCKDASQARRLLAIALVMDGVMQRQEIARQCGTDLQTLCDWVHRFNLEGPEGLKDKTRPGRPTRLDDSQKEMVRQWLKEGPDPEATGLSRWTLEDIRRLILETFAVRYTIEGVRLLVRQFDFRHLSPRPVHPKADVQRQEEFRSNFRELVENAVPDGTALESVDVWFQDEARIGQKGMLSRIWAPLGSRPPVVRDHRYGYCYQFSAASPTAGQAVGHSCARANTDEMNRHLLDLSAVVPQGRHGVVVLDGAGWHRSKALEVPDNLTLLRLPPYSPELNSMENVFGVLKRKHFANRVFATVDDVRKTVDTVWQKFANTPEQIASIMSRQWATLA